MKVSIICTNYNKGKWIQDSLDSLLHQKTDFPFEILVVDDASTDDSVQIIREYEKKYPRIIRAYYHEKNMGITKTWKSIVGEATGDYIARCDGDDYWTDSKKLQKQVELLESHPTAQWSNTDFDMIDQEGNILHPNVFENKILPLAKTYEEMLVYKSMTMSSTWLVEANLMKQVTNILDNDAVDDTYNLQLELFRKTELVTLMESTTVYRMNIGSDSKPTSLEEFTKRFTGLKNTQKKYLQKYPYGEKVLIDMLLDKDCSSEIEIFKRDLEINQANQLSNQLRDISDNQHTYIEELESSIAQKQHEYSNTLQQVNDLSEKYNSLLHQYNSVIHSRRWTIPTKIINFFRRNK